MNDYLRAVSGEDFTAKDFRTWAGTVLASMALREFEESASETEAKKNVVEAIKTVAKRLGNTPAVCRKCYVHPAVLECYLAGKLERRIRRKIEKASEEVLREAEEESLQKEGAVTGTSGNEASARKSEFTARSVSLLAAWPHFNCACV